MERELRKKLSNFDGNPDQVRPELGLWYGCGYVTRRPSDIPRYWVCFTPSLLDSNNFAGSERERERERERSLMDVLVLSGNLQSLNDYMYVILYAGDNRVD